MLSKSECVAGIAFFFCRVSGNFSLLNLLFERILTTSVSQSFTCPFPLQKASFKKHPSILKIAHVP